ncbi:hypothetical protein [Leptolyngbya sp. GB1-A1]
MTDRRIGMQQYSLNLKLQRSINGRSPERRAVLSEQLSAHLSIRV